MAKIELSAEEINVIHQQLNGEIEIWNATDTQQQLLMGVIDKANAKLDEYPEDYEFGDDLIRWFWDLYQAQEAQS